MSTEHRESDLVRSWLDESYQAEREPHEYLAHLLDEVPDTPQRRRRWHLPRLRPARAVPTADDTTPYRPMPIPATNGHSPTVTGRTRSMLSPAKAITAGALAFAIGAAFLVAQPFDKQSRVPGATVDVEPTWVAGTVELADDCRRGGAASSENGVISERFDCRDEAWTADDPRLTGQVRKMWQSDAYRTAGAGYQSVIANRYVMETEGGSWECGSVQVGRGTGITANVQGTDTITCVGGGGLAGLTAIVLADWGQVGHPFEAIIFSGEVPAAPDASGFE